MGEEDVLAGRMISRMTEIPVQKGTNNLHKEPEASIRIRWLR
jgi:hypothetical protein